MKINSLLVALLILPSIALAAPSVSGVSDGSGGIIIVENGAAMVISGSSFGSKSPAAPRLWDTISNQSAYTALGVASGDLVPSVGGNIHGGSPTHPDCPWRKTNDTGGFLRVHDSDNRVLGRPFYRFSGPGYLLGWDYGGATPEILFVSWFVRSNLRIHRYLLPSGSYNHSSSTKFIRSWSSYNNSQDYDAWISWTQMHCTPTQDDDHDCSEDGTSTTAAWGVWYGDQILDTWHHMESIADGTGNYNCGYGTYMAYVNNRRRINDLFWAPANEPVNSLYELGFGANDSSWFITNGINFDVSDIYVDTTYSRVVIGNRSAWADCTEYEMQIPTAWATGEITVTVNTGTFTDGAQGYLYVFDSSNNVNATGFSVTIAAAGDPPPAVTTITRPDSLRVE